MIVYQFHEIFSEHTFCKIQFLRCEHVTPENSNCTCHKFPFIFKQFALQNIPQVKSLYWVIKSDFCKITFQFTMWKRKGLCDFWPKFLWHFTNDRKSTKYDWNHEKLRTPTFTDNFLIGNIGRVSNSQCGNFIIFLSFRFYVKLICGKCVQY